MNERAPKLPSSSTPGNISIFTLDQEHIDLHALRHKASESAPSDVPITSLLEIARAQTWDTPESDVSPAKIMNELERGNGDFSLVQANRPEWSARLERILQADYSHPILIYKGVIVDGLHRLLHAMIDRKEVIAAHVFETLPPEAVVDSARKQTLVR